jgi:hypothetical protein
MFRQLLSNKNKITIVFHGIYCVKLVVSKQALSSKKVHYAKKKILHHIKLAIHAWSIKYRGNQKLISQLGAKS